MVRRPLQEFCDSSPAESIAILVDSLDEALSFNPDTNIAQLLRLVQDFPRQVRFLLTCRSKNQRVFDLVGQPTLDLIADAPRRPRRGEDICRRPACRSPGAGAKRRGGTCRPEEQGQLSLRIPCPQ